MYIFNVNDFKWTLVIIEIDVQCLGLMIAFFYLQFITLLHT